MHGLLHRSALMSTSDQGLLNMSTSLLVFEVTNLMLLSNNLQVCVVEGSR